MLANYLSATVTIVVVLKINSLVSCQRAAMSGNDAQLRAEIKQLLKEAAALSEPSTFAQSAKLRRMAAAKERELAKSQESASKDIKKSLILYGKLLMISKVVLYLALIVWFWRVPVAAISKELVQPFGLANIFAIKSGNRLYGNDDVSIFNPEKVQRDRKL
ncbi:R-linalool synthase [Tanacetum coccineum]